MIIVDDIVGVTPQTNKEWEVHGTLLRDNESPNIKWQAVLPVYLIGADTAEMAVEIYKENYLKTAAKEVLEMIRSGLHRLHARAKEVGRTAPYRYGDHAEVQMTLLNGDPYWETVIVKDAERLASASRWLVNFLHGWVGSAPMIGRAWCDDNGHGELIRPSLLKPLDLVIPMQEVFA